MPILDAKDVTFRYTHEDEGVTDTASVVPPAVLCGVDLAIEPGTFVALLGHNGCGGRCSGQLHDPSAEYFP